MPEGPIRRLVIVVLAIVLMTGLLVDSAAQKRKRTKRRTRPSAPRITNPEIYQPSPAENANSNSENSTNENSNANSNANASRPEDPESMKRTIRTLSNQVDKLNDKITEMQASQQSMVDLERLGRAEQRASQLRNELRDVQSKRADLEIHLVQVEYDLKPENIERAAAGYGTTRPEELRADLAASPLGTFAKKRCRRVLVHEAVGGTYLRRRLRWRFSAIHLARAWR